MRLILFADFDYTVHDPDNPQHDGVLDEYLCELKGQGVEVYMCYVTGRSHANFIEKIAPLAVPRPDFAICGVGTQMFDFSHGAVYEKWHAHLVIQEEAGWHNEQVQADMRAFFDARGTIAPEVDPAWVLPHKISYLVDKMLVEDLAALQVHFAEAGHKVNLVYSEQKFLDILPAGCNKGLAIDWFVREHHIQPSKDDIIVFAGDSGNDIAGFASEALTHRIVVGNRHELVNALAQSGLLERCMHMKDGFGPLQVVAALKKILG
ncbi:MAG: HAD-IIB family hydrolase [Alphaproteobacteria bacterium]